MVMRLTPLAQATNQEFKARYLVTAMLFAMVQATLLIFCEFGPVGLASPHHTDLAIPEATAARMMAGLVPYRDFPSEYPPLALPFFWLPQWVGGSWPGFPWMFAIEVLLFHTGTLFLVARQVARERDAPSLRSQLAWFLGYSLALWPVLLTRYDPIPTFFAFAAVAGWSVGRPLRAGVWAGLGFLNKLFPGFVLLPQLTRDWPRMRSASSLAFLGLGGTVALGMIAWLTFGRSGVWESIRFHGDRRIEVESLFASLIYLTDFVVGSPPIVMFNFGAFHLLGDLPTLFSLISLPLLLFALLFVCWQARRDGVGNQARYSCGCLLAFIVTNKVLSPQYLIWLIPFIVTLRGRWAEWVRPAFAVCCVLTTIIYPYLFEALVAVHPGAVFVLALRNLILLVISLAVWSPRFGRGIKENG